MDHQQENMTQDLSVFTSVLLIVRVPVLYAEQKKFDCPSSTSGDNKLDRNAGYTIGTYRLSENSLRIQIRLIVSGYCVLCRGIRLCSGCKTSSLL